MIEFDEATMSVKVSTTFSWEGTVLPLIERVKNYYGEEYEDNIVDDPEAVENFLNCNLEDYKLDIMQYVVDRMECDEDEDSFSIDYSVQTSILNWIEDQFNFSVDNAAEIFN